MSRERLRLFLRRRQLTNDTGNVIVQCNPDGSATYVSGTLDSTWQEFTDLTGGLDQLALSWDATNAASSDNNPSGSNYDKGISLELTFNDEAFTFIWDHLQGSRCAGLNTIEVRIDDALCGKTYRFFEIKADNLDYAPFARPCETTARLREMDAAWHAVHKTFIWDNWQNWFKDGSAKSHPCFLTGIEPRPRLVNSARFAFALLWQTIPLNPGIPLPGGNPVFRRIVNVDNFVDAPLIRDIITNVCDKYSIGYDTMFHDPLNPYYNLCLYYPSAGVMHVNDTITMQASATWYHFENRWNITLAELLDYLKKVFKARWYVTPNNTLFFYPLGELDTTPLLDLTTSDRWDRETLEYSFNEQKKPAYGRYEYGIDSADLGSQEVQPLYNDIVDYDGPADNLMLEGKREQRLDFASTAFIRDGKSRGDYLRDLCNDGETGAYAIIVLLAVVTAALLAGVLSAGAAAALAGFLGMWSANIAARANDLRNMFAQVAYTGAVRITAEELATPRLLIWDGVSRARAKVVADYPADIEPNLYYNPTGMTYSTRNPFQYIPVGGQFVFNYPMYFDSYFLNNLFDRYHDQLDNPMRTPEVNQQFELVLDLCCDHLDALGVWAGDFAKIGYFVKLESREGFDVLGRIEHFEVLYREEQISVRGKVFYVNSTP